jgi:hypothetical protein
MFVGKVSHIPDRASSHCFLLLQFKVNTLQKGSTQCTAVGIQAVTFLQVFNVFNLNG